MTKEQIYKRVSLNKETVIEDITKDPNNPIMAFKNSLTKEEVKLGIANLSDDKKYEFIVALFNFQLLTIPYLDECALRTQLLFSNTLLSQGIKNFELKVSFKGTVENVKTESYKYVFRQIEDVEAYKEKEKNEEKLREEQALVEEEEEKEILKFIEQEYLDGEMDEEDLKDLMENGISPIEYMTKFDMLINQKDVVLEIFNEIKSKIEDPSEREICLATAGFLISAELLSISNLSYQKSFYENLSNGSIKTNKSYEAKVVRDMVEYQLTNTQNSQYKIH